MEISIAIHHVNRKYQIEDPLLTCFKTLDKSLDISELDIYNNDSNKSYSNNYYYYYSCSSALFIK